MEGRKNPNHPAFYAHVALAKLGDADAVQAIVAEVDNKSPAIQDLGIRKLSLVGRKVAYEKLYELLDDKKPRPNTDCQKIFEEENQRHPENKREPYCDVVYLDRSLTVIAILQKTVKNPPGKARSGSDEEIELWKKWIVEKVNGNY